MKIIIIHSTKGHPIATLHVATYIIANYFVFKLINQIKMSAEMLSWHSVASYPGWVRG